jgi:hypothetical protein
LKTTGDLRLSKNTHGIGVLLHFPDSVDYLHIKSNPRLFSGYCMQLVPTYTLFSSRNFKALGIPQNYSFVHNKFRYLSLKNPRTLQSHEK